MWGVLTGALLLPGVGRGRSLDFFESYSLGVYGGLENTSFYYAGLQAMTLEGPGDSALFGGHLGLGLDVGYARMGNAAHHIRIQPMAELLLLCLVYAQAGAGAFVDVEDPALSGLDLMLGVGLRMFLGDEYQSPSISLGGRFDWAVAGRTEFVPSAFAQLTFYIDP
ncbi:MAG: hypothetical protein ABIK09_07505 [Pseudomonadota bacterium]